MKEEAIFRKRVKKRKIEQFRKSTLHTFNIGNKAHSNLKNILQRGQVVFTRLEKKDKMLAGNALQEVIIGSRKIMLMIYEKNMILNRQAKEEIKLIWK